SRLGISAMIDKNGFHLPSVEIFDSSEDHSMTSAHFIEWIKKAAFRPREDNGQNRRIAIVIDNAIWHSELMESSKPAKRSMRKDQIIECVYELASEFIAGFNDKAAQSAMCRAEKVETTYKAADEFVENTVEPQLIDDVSDIETDNFSDASDDSTEL
ncbi:unnamed protein product, partial [Rotaria sordida]